MAPAGFFCEQRLSVLDFELGDTLTDALTAFDIPQGVTVRRTTVSGTPYSPTTTTADYAGKGWVDTYSTFDLADSTVRASDRKVFILVSSLLIVPTTADRMVIGGTTHTIISVQLDPAGAAWVCQCRA